MNVSMGRSVIWVLVVIFLIFGAILVYSNILNQRANTFMKTVNIPSKNKVASAGHTSKLKRVKMGLKPGESFGNNPRFLNIGKSEAFIMKDEEGIYYIMGKVKINQIINGKTKISCEIENRKYDPRRK